MIPESTNYESVPTEIIAFLQETLMKIQQMDISADDAQLITKALNNLDSHPAVPDADLVIAFRLDDITYTLVYSSYKIELSDYVTEYSKMGDNYYHQFIFSYTPESVFEEQGDFIEFQYLFSDALSEIPDSEIEINDEEWKTIG